MGIKWEYNNKKWNNDQSMIWDNIPNEVEKQLRDFSKELQKNTKYHEFPSKHKYAYVLGANKTETKELRKKFIQKNKLEKYPKERGK